MFDIAIGKRIRFIYINIFNIHIDVNNNIVIVNQNQSTNAIHAAMRAMIINIIMIMIDDAE
jgi:hypothetical protein